MARSKRKRAPTTLWEAAERTVRFALENNARSARLAALMIIAVICYYLFF